MTDDELIRRSWEEFERDGSLVGHLDRVLRPRSRWPEDRPVVNWGRVAWFSLLGSIGALLGAWWVAR